MTPADSLALRIWESVGNIGWLLVWAGCLGEGLSEFTKFPKNETRRHKLGKISWFVLLAGLALEFWGTGRAVRIKDLEVARLRAEASAANQRSSDAGVIAARAEQAAAEANSHLAQANLAAAEAQRDAAVARLEGEKLKALVAWREISPTQRTTFRTLTKIAPKGQIIVSSVAENAEAANFARQIAGMLTDSGYTVTENLGARTSFGTPDVGAFVEFRSLEFPAPHGLAVQQALAAIDIVAPVRPSGAESNIVTIFVGSRPSSK